MPDQLKSLHVFCRVGRLSSFSAAANELNMSQSMVSKYISYLEDRVGAKLVDRTTRTVRLTPAGTNFLASCSKIIEAVEEAERAVKADTPGEMLGSVKLHAPIFLAAEYLLPAVYALKRQYPNIAASVDASDRIINPLQEHFDIAFTIDIRMDNVEVIELYQTERVLAAAPSYLESRGIPRSIGCLSRHDCIAMYQSTQFGKSFWSFGARGEKTISFDGKLVLNNELAIMHAGVAGMGIVHLPAIVLEPAFDAGVLVGLELEDADITPVRIYATRPMGRPWTEPIEQLLGFVERRLHNHRSPFRPVPLP